MCGDPEYWGKFFLASRRSIWRLVVRTNCPQSASAKDSVPSVSGLKWLAMLAKFVSSEVRQFEYREQFMNSTLNIHG